MNLIGEAAASDSSDDDAPLVNLLPIARRLSRRNRGHREVDPNLEHALLDIDAGSDGDAENSEGDAGAADDEERSEGEGEEGFPPEDASGPQDAGAEAGSDDPDHVEEQQQGDNWSVTQVAWMTLGGFVVCGVLVSIHCDAFDADIAMHDVLTDTMLKFDPELLLMWMVSYERGTINNSGHIHLLMEGPLDMSKGGMQKLRNWIRKLLKLNAQFVNGVKVKYKVHIKPIIKATQAVQLYAAYLVKDVGAQHSRISMGGDNADPAAFDDWCRKYRQLNPDIFKDKVVIDLDTTVKHAHAYYIANLFPLPLTLLTIVWVMCQSGPHLLITEQLIN